MSHQRRIFWTIASLLSFWAAQPWTAKSWAQQASPPAPLAPVVVELFTSQSCSSCPPADEVLGELAQRAEVIALGCHVTYWDHLDWQDTLSLPACTGRQRDYAAQMGSNQVYTPQMVVNGRVEFVGSRRSTALNEVERAQGVLKAIALTRHGDALIAQLPQLPTNQLQTLWLVAYGDAYTQAMKSGENRGRSVAYVNPVVAMESLGVWHGQAETRTIALIPALQNDPDMGGYVIIAQSEATGSVAAAGKVGISDR